MTDVVHTRRRLPELDATPERRIALVDLVQVSLRTLISSVSTLERERAGDE